MFSDVYFLVLELGAGEPRLKHVVADFEDDDAAGYAETVGGYAEEHEDELAGEDEDDEDDEGRDGGALDDEAALLLAHALRHGEEHGHRAERVGKCEQRSEAQQCVRQ